MSYSQHLSHLAYFPLSDGETRSWGRQTPQYNVLVKWHLEMFPGRARFFSFWQIQGSASPNRKGSGDLDVHSSQAHPSCSVRSVSGACCRTWLWYMDLWILRAWAFPRYLMLSVRRWVWCSVQRILRLKDTIFFKGNVRALWVSLLFSVQNSLNPSDEKPTLQIVWSLLLDEFTTQYRDSLFPTLLTQSYIN